MNGFVAFLRFRHRWVRDDGAIVSRLPWHSLTYDDVGHKLRLIVCPRQVPRWMRLR